MNAIKKYHLVDADTDESIGFGKTSEITVGQSMIFFMTTGKVMRIPSPVTSIEDEGYSLKVDTKEKKYRLFKR